MKFVSSLKHRQSSTFTRLPISFPDIQLTLQRLSDAQVTQIKETGWLREVVFRTTPNVTKIEIKEYIESVYGMKVERVNTANYLGQKRILYIAGKREIYREDDYKKVFVIFEKPDGITIPEPEPEPTDDRSFIQKLVDIKIKHRDDI